MWTRALKDKRGFSLAEVVLAIAFLAAAAALVGGLMVVSTQAHRTSERGGQAVHIAMREAERLKSVSFSDLTSRAEQNVPGYPGFEVKADVQALNIYTKRVTVSVTYPEQGGGWGTQQLVFERTGGL